MIEKYHSYNQYLIHYRLLPPTGVSQQKGKVTTVCIWSDSVVNLRFIPTTCMIFKENSIGTGTENCKTA